MMRGRGTFFIIVSTLVAFVVTGIALPARSATSPAAAQAEIAEKNQQIAELERQIREYQQKVAAIAADAKTLANAIAQLNYQIRQRELEIQSLELGIKRNDIEISQTQQGISEAEQKVTLQKDGIGAFLRRVQQSDNESLLEILLKNDSLSNFFNNLDNLRAAQAQAQVMIENLGVLKKELQQQQEMLEVKRTEQVSLRQIQEAQRAELASTKQEQDELYKETKGEENRYREIVATKQKDLQRLRREIEALLAQGVTLEDAIKFGQLVANRVGIDPSFLLALLTVESRLGQNTGTGTWRTDMYECYIKIGKPERAQQEKAAYLQITSELGIDPDSVRVSREPSYGCGGAMGPAQFIPTTWLGWKDKVAATTGHNPPNPWNVEDSFTAAALKLASGGATSRDLAGENRAARAYICGNPNSTSQTCASYSNLVQTTKVKIARDLPVQ